jgi:hypothetical protein
MHDSLGLLWRIGNRYRVRVRAGLWLALYLISSGLQLVGSGLATAGTYDHSWKLSALYSTTPQGTCTQAPKTTAIAGASNPERAFNYFIAQGLTPVQSAGIVGNLVEESHVNPLIHEGGALVPPYPIADQGFGIAQWTPANRQQGLVAFADARQQPVTDLIVQLDYIWQEMTNASAWSDTLPAIKAATTVEDAAFAFHRDYEVSADTIDMIQERVAAGQNILDRFGQNPVTNNTTQVCSNAGQPTAAPPAIAPASPTAGPIPNCTVYAPNGSLRVGQLHGNEAILACAKLFDPYGHDFGAGHFAPSQWMAWWERQGGFKNTTFRQILDCSSLEMLAIYLAFGQELIFNADTIATMPNFFRGIQLVDARAGDIMVRPGHTEIAISDGGARSFGARTTGISQTEQISESTNSAWTAAYTYIGPGSSRK